MAKPEDIPKDIWDATGRVLDGYLYSPMSADEAIARAIMAEREACARIAEDADDTGIHQWGEDRNSVVAQRAGRDVAAAIRKRSE